MKTCAVCGDLVRNPQHSKIVPINGQNLRPLVLCWKCAAADTARADLVTSFLQAKILLSREGKIPRLAINWEDEFDGPGQT